MNAPSIFRHRPSIAHTSTGAAPVEIFQRVYGSEQYGFLYESLENERQRGRYSFVGGRPAIVFQARKGSCTVTSKDRTTNCLGDPFTILETLVSPGQQPSVGEVFTGGAVGYVAYDAVRNIERLPDSNPEDPLVPECYFLFPTEIIIFDHYTTNVSVICYSNEQRAEDLRWIIRDAKKSVIHSSCNCRDVAAKPNMERIEFCEMVNKAKQYIRRGDVFQVVLSQRLVIPVTTDPFNVYRNLRITNPSPYMYFLKLNQLAVLGSSPETLIKLHNRRVLSRPIAGTRPRGQDDEEDLSLADELLNDEKERAEHIMLVDLSRNDVGRVSLWGSVKVAELMKIERFSKVMHITSQVTGDLASGLNAFDALRAAFPAGTVSGAPKVRAMEIIDELETVRRGIYAGAIGYFGFDGNMDFCIAIRTIVIKDNTAYIQGGAGIVADSIPEHEYEETLNKISALYRALELVS